MKIAVVNTHSGGGAGIAAQRHVQLLRDAGFTADIFTNKNFGKVRKIISRVLDKVEIFFIGRLISSKYLATLNLFSLFNWKKELRGYDIVILHWTSGNFVSPRSIGGISRLGCRVYLYMHDEWYVNAIAHYKDNADKENFIAKLLLSRYKNYKSNVYKKYVSGFIAPTDYLVNLVARDNSTIPSYKLENPYTDSVLEGTFRDIDVLFFASGGVTDPRKGFQHFHRMLEILSDMRLNVVIGGSDGKNFCLNSLRVNFEGELDIHAVKQILARTKVMLHCSSADNYPNGILECLFYNVEVFGFDVGGVKEVLVDKTKIFPYGDVETMAKCVRETLEDYKEPDYRPIVKERNYQNVMLKYRKLFK